MGPLPSFYLSMQPSIPPSIYPSFSLFLHSVSLHIQPSIYLDSPYLSYLSHVSYLSTHRSIYLTIKPLYRLPFCSSHHSSISLTSPHRTACTPVLLPLTALTHVLLPSIMSVYLLTFHSKSKDSIYQLLPQSNYHYPTACSLLLICRFARAVNAK